MEDPLDTDDAGRKSGQSPHDGDDDRSPRWVWVSGLVVLVLHTLFVILHLTGHGLHGHT